MDYESLSSPFHYGGAVEDDLLNKIYNSTSGSFRKTLKMVYRILTNFSRLPGKKEIFESDVRDLFLDEYKEAIVKLQKTKYDFKIIKILQSNNGCSQKVIQDKLEGIKQSNCSRTLKMLENSGYIRSEKESTVKKYFLLEDWFFVKLPD